MSPRAQQAAKADQMSMAPHSSKTLRHQHGLRWLFRPPNIHMPLNVLPHGNRSHEHQFRCQLLQGHRKDMALTSRTGPDDTVAPGGSAGHSDWHGLHSSVALGHQHGTRHLAFSLNPKPQDELGGMVSGLCFSSQSGHIEQIFFLCFFSIVP